MVEFDWDIKHRPKTFDEMVGQERIVNYYKQCKATNGRIRHAIFRGRCGIGKTTMARVIENEFGVKMMSINGSKDRTLSFFRDRIIPAMRVAPFQGKFRLIFIDETESMLSEAWLVLKTPLEDYKHNCSIIFACNDDKNIPEAIRSRCDVFDFAPISKNDTIKRLMQIAKMEKLEIKDDVLNVIYDKSKGDLRKSITLMENYSKKAMDFGKNEFEDMFILTR